MKYRYRQWTDRRVGDPWLRREADIEPVDQDGVGRLTSAIPVSLSSHAEGGDIL